MQKRHGFTLAEVLITLGIIGIIAEITIPTLMLKMLEQQTAGMLKKEYSVLSSAYTLAVQENGTPDNWNLGGSDDPTGAMNILNMLSPYMKIVKTCGNDTGCFPTGYKLLNGTFRGSDFDTYTPYAKAQLADGSIFFTFVRDANCAMQRGSSLALLNLCGAIGVDINGFKGPNQDGHDFFQFYITKYGLVPVGTQQEYDTYNSFATSCQDTTKVGYGCAAWVIYNENMDYLHCSTLSWNGPTKCQ